MALRLCLTPSSLASTDVSSQIEDADADIYAGVADKHLMEYVKERSITWEDLKKTSHRCLEVKN